MATQAYFDWVKDGSPFTLATPCRDLQRLLQAAGFTVFAYPDIPHLTADRPEDHTPFSFTGWPIKSPYGYGHALDIMPKAGLMPLSQLAQRIIDAKRTGMAGAQWIKYINWTDADDITHHISWQSTEAIVSSDDKGHIHISARSDRTLSTEVSQSGWNPLITGGNVALTTEDKAFIRAQMWGYIDPGDKSAHDIVLGEIRLNAKAAADAAPVLSKLDDIKAAIGTAATEEDLARALVSVLADTPSVVDALATAVASRVGMVPTAREIAKAIGELIWHGTPGS